jgi:hypothetical protein
MGGSSLRRYAGQGCPSAVRWRIRLLRRGGIGGATSVR